MPNQLPHKLPTQPMPSVPMSQFLYDILVSVLGVSTTLSPEGRYDELNEYLHCFGYAQPDESFDTLLWSKENRKKYLILYRIAKYIIAYPPSIVEIESAFSVGKWILDNKRASLMPSTINIHICLKDWQMAYNRSQDQPRPDDNKDDIDQFVLLSFSYCSKASGGNFVDKASDDVE